MPRELFDCSMCEEELTGRVVVLADEYSAPDFSWGGLKTYIGAAEAGSTEYVILHAVCFDRQMAEFMRQEGETALLMVITTAGNVREAIQFDKEGDEEDGESA